MLCFFQSYASHANSCHRILFAVAVQVPFFFFFLWPFFWPFYCSDHVLQMIGFNALQEGMWPVMLETCLLSWLTFFLLFFFFAVPTGHLKPLYREKATAEFDEHEV